MGFKKAASAQQANYACGKCGEKFIEGKEIFMQKRQDGSWFSCHNLECFKSQGGTLEEKKSFSSSKSPIEDAPKIFTLAETLLESFKKKRNLIPLNTLDAFDVDSPTSLSTTLPIEKFEPLTTEQELQAVESFFKTLSGGFKP